MHVLFVLGIDMSSNGPSVHLLNDIMEELRKGGHQITRIQKRYRSNSWQVTQENDNGDTVFICETAEPHTLNYVDRYISELKYVKKCKTTLKNGCFDAVFLQSCNNAGYQVWWMKRKLSCPIVYNVQDIFPMDLISDGTISPRGIIYKVLSRIQDYAYRNSQRVITISEDMKNSLLSLGVDRDKLRIIYNWAYEDTYNSEYDAEVKNTYYSDDCFHVVYAGNIGTAQNVEMLVKASEYLLDEKSIKILIIGKGARLKKCKVMAQEMGLTNISFYDLAPQYLAQYVYNNAGVNIVTLAKGIYKTSMPSKTAACYKSGKPVIYCVEDEAQTIRKLVSANPMIYQCKPDDPEMLAEKIRQVYSEQKKHNIVTHISYEDVLKPQGARFYVEELEGCNR